MRSMASATGCVEAMRVDAPRLGMAARLVEAFHAAGRAEQMLGGAGAEPIAGRARRGRSRSSNSLMRDHDMEEAGHRADRAIAVERGNRRLGHFRPNRTAPQWHPPERSSFYQAAQPIDRRGRCQPRPGAERGAISMFGLSRRSDQHRRADSGRGHLLALLEGLRNGLDAAAANRRSCRPGRRRTPFRRLPGRLARRRSSVCWPTCSTGRDRRSGRCWSR